MPSTAAEIHKYGTSDSWHGCIEVGGQFPPEHDRYHFYVGLFCPFAHRVNIVRHLIGLQDVLPVSVLRPYPYGDLNTGYPGWKFPEDGDDYPGTTKDRIFDSTYLHEIFFKDDPEYKGRYTVPVIWDKKQNRIVSTESAELLRSLPDSFKPTLDPDKAEIDLYPPHLRSQIDELSPWIQSDLNAGVYKAGFAPDQEAYDTNVVLIFAALNRLESLISESGGPYILGKQLTELDIRAYTTIVRFDPIYVNFFNANLGTIRHNYPVINNWLKNLYWNTPGFRETTDFKHIKENYFKCHTEIGPKLIVPMGPLPDVEEGFEPDFSKIKPGYVPLPEPRMQGAEKDVVHSKDGNFSIAKY